MRDGKSRLGCGKLVLIAVGILIGLVVLGSIVGPKDGKRVRSAAVISAADTDQPKVERSALEEKGSKTLPSVIPLEQADAISLTGPQENAVRSAKQYLAMSGFSRDGLISQLSSDAGEGYSVNDAAVAVESLNVDWNENAARSAKQYLDMSGFSCSGLINQLSSRAGDKYTKAQATYGAHQAGAC